MAIIEESFSVECDDRISQLPDDVLCLILSLLSFRERARMRLLCSRWKVLSQFTFDLRLNLLSIFGIYINSFSFNDMKEMLRHKSKFLTAVTQILKLYTGRKLDTFEVSFPLEDDSASNVDQWISSALEHGVNRLKIDFGPPPMGTESYYTFPFHLLPDGKTSPLKHLSLKFCEVFVVPGNAIKFNSLVTLYIGHARINQVSLDSILSGCVNLEFLRIKMCIVPKICCITGALGRLKRLIMEYCLHRGHIELNSLPELTTFEYMGGVKKFTLRSLPSLEKMYFRFENLSSEGMHSVFINKLAEDVSHLQTLSLFLVPFEEPPMPASMTPFKYLKNLELFIVVSPNYDLLTIVHILNVSHVLQKFLLSLSCSLSPYISKDNLTSNASGIIDKRCINFHIKEVEICGFSDRFNCMELAIYLLDRAVSLKRMLINFQGREYHGVDRWTYSKLFPMNLTREVTRDLLQKHNVDSKVEVIVN